MKSFTLITSLLIFSLAGCGGDDTPPNVDNGASPPGQDGRNSTPIVPSGFESPEAAFAALQKAADQKDFAAMAAALTKESQQAIAGSMVFALGFVAAFDEDKAEEITKLLEKHGISEDRNEAGPGIDPDAGPAAGMRAFGSMTHDPAAFIAEAMNMMDESPDGGNDFAAGTLGDVIYDGIDEDFASATLTTPEEEKPIEFRRTPKGWLVHIPDDEFNQMGMGEGGESSGGFDDFDFHYDEADELPPPDALTMEEFDKAWQTSVDYQDRGALEVLTELTEECGLAFFEQPEFEETLNQPVTVKLENVSRLQVIEAVCEQLNLYPRYKLKTIAFAEGPRPFPITFAGPFLVAVESVSEYVPYGAGQINLSFVAAGIPTATAARLTELNMASEEDHDDSLTLIAGPITGGSQELQGDSTGGQMRQGSTSTVTFTSGYKLRNLLNTVETIDAIDGRLSWSFPSKIAILKFDKLEKDAIAQAGDIKLTLTRSDLSANSQFDMKVEGVSYRNVQIVGRDDNGNAMENNFTSGSSSGDNEQIDLMVDGRPATLEARIVEASERVAYDFQIPPIPLPSHEQMPDKLTELTIKGDSPATFKFVDISGDENFKKIKLEVTNHTNKDIHLIHMKLDYLGADGKSLKEWQSTEFGDRVLLKSGATKTIEVTGFFMPEETKSVQATPDSIEFADATEWASE